MILAVLGSGTAYPSIERSNSSYLIEAGKEKILFDSGSGTIRQLLKLKINIMDIGHIFYTHLHNDHISDLPAIIWSNNYGLKRKKALNIYGPKGFKKYYKDLYSKILGSPKLSYKVNVFEMKDDDDVKIGKGVKITSKKMKHKGECVGYRICHDKKIIVYTGDLGYSNNAIKLAKDSDLLVIECAYPDKITFPHHMTPSRCGEIASKARVRKMLLTHFYPEAEKVDVLKQARKTYQGVVLKAKDLMKVRV